VIISVFATGAEVPKGKTMRALMRHGKKFKKGELSEIVPPKGLGFWYTTHV